MCRASDRFGLLYDETFDRDLHAGLGPIDFLEIIPDRFSSLQDARRFTESFPAIPVVFHSLNMSLGSDEPLDNAYLDRICSLAGELHPMWASDHLAITQIGGSRLGQLSPIRYAKSNVERIADRIKRAQDALQLPFLIENITYYFRVPGGDISEVQLLHDLVEKTRCGILLDLNNVAVNAANHGFDAYVDLAELPLQAVGEIHLAGRRRSGNFYVDSHGEPVDDVVWKLLEFVSARLDPVNVILERDQNIPPLSELIAELERARKTVDRGRSTELAVSHTIAAGESSDGH